MSKDLKNLKFSDLEIKVVTCDDAVVLNWHGSIHVPNPEDYLDEYLFSAVEFAGEQKKKLVCHFKHLEYMNSSSIPPLIETLRNLSERQIEGEFIYDKSRKVQVASFRALEVIAQKLNHVKIQGE